ncbi:MAG TPA: YifB family Mg chelatase-like AAA ATPase [bacterium]|nr:YifB family Mg chelatase-like AAA ATPase [bacterium]
MSAKVMSAGLVGLEAELIEAEADIGSGEIGTFIIVGLPDASIFEARERIRSAFRNSNLELPKLKITINLAPADLRKQGPNYDLPIALSILLANNQLPLGCLDKVLCLGELSLDGHLRPISGVLPAVQKARNSGLRAVIVPIDNSSEASLVEGIEIWPAESLKQIVFQLKQKTEPIAVKQIAIEQEKSSLVSAYDFCDIKGQVLAKRALLIAAAGHHNLLMIGPPGSGKTLLAQTLPSIMADLTDQEALEVASIYSVAGQFKVSAGLPRQRPFRQPHHSASAAAVIGGGIWPRPGEISLAHRGVLFLDELPEFSRPVLEGLRQPLENGLVTVNRVSGQLIFPAKCLLAAAMNPCPCGFLGDNRQACQCSPKQVANYRRRLSGPLLDRLDLQLTVPRVPIDDLTSDQLAEDSASLRQKVLAAREKQSKRFLGTRFINNGELTSGAIKDFCQVDQAGQMILRQAIDRLNLSARGYYRVLRLARTIADLADEPTIAKIHITESLQYRFPNY